MKISFKKIAKSLTGVSTPFFGISWTPPESDREVVRSLITFFEDRRALYNPFNVETPQLVVRSVLEIRKELTNTLQKLGDNPDISPHLRAMRAACRKFLDETEELKRTGHPYRRYWGGENFFAALGEMRAIFGIHIAQLCVKYGIDVEKDLASILPSEDRETKKSKSRDITDNGSVMNPLGPVIRSWYVPISDETEPREQ